MWQLLRDKKETREALNREKESARPDEAILTGLRAALKETNDEIRDYGRRLAPSKEPDPPRIISPNDRNAGTYNEGGTTDGAKAKIRGTA